MLLNEQRKEYDYFSRYQNTSYYYDTRDDKYVMGITQWLDDTTPYIKHTVQRNDTYDTLALQYYNNPTYWWVIADFNRVLDPFIKPSVGIEIKIPIFSNLQFQGEV